MWILRAPDGITAADRAGDSPALLVPELVPVLASLPPLDPPVPRLTSAASTLELLEERRQIAPALLGLMILPLRRRSR